VEVGQDKSEDVMKKPWEARATPHSEHLLHSSNSTTHHLPMLSISVVLLYLKYTKLEKKVKKIVASSLVCEYVVALMGLAC
jgi:hypothetical protein